MTPLHVVILAAGHGKRMRSSLPKVLHFLAGRPLLSYVIDAANGLGAARVHVVYGHGGGAVREAMVDADVEWVEQSEQLGTGHAVTSAMAGIPDRATVLVLYGDVPLVNRTTLHETETLAADSGIALITAVVADPSGYGRIVRGPDGAVRGIVEEGDADDEQRGIAEINTGILAAHAGRLRGWLRGLSRDNAQGEHYLTDVIARAVEDGLSVRTVPPEAIEEVLGVNDRAQLAALERFQQRRLAETLMRDGASLADPARIDIRGHVRTGSDVFVDVNVVFEGEVDLGDRVSIGPGCVIRDTVIEHDTEIRAHCVIEGARIGVACRIGPFAAAAPGYPDVSRVPHRKLRRGQERDHRRRLEGEPPDLHRRQPDRRRRQRGRGRRHLQLRRRQQAHDGDRRRRLHRLRRDARRTGHRAHRRDDRSGLDHRQGCAARCPHRDPGAAEDFRGLAAPAQAPRERVRAHAPSGLRKVVRAVRADHARVPRDSEPISTDDRDAGNAILHGVGMRCPARPHWTVPV